MSSDWRRGRCAGAGGPAERGALRIQFATLALLAVIVGAVVESVFQPGGFHLIILVVGPIVFGAVWGVLFRDTTARLGDAALAREAAKAVTDDHRVLVGLRLVPRTDVEVLIATDREVIAAQPVGHGRWGITW